MKASDVGDASRLLDELKKARDDAMNLDRSVRSASAPLTVIAQWTAGPSVMTVKLELTDNASCEDVLNAMHDAAGRLAGAIEGRLRVLGITEVDV